MKKTVSFLLAICLSFASCALLASCNDSNNSSSSTNSIDESITKEEWDNMLSENNFENYTLVTHATMQQSSSIPVTMHQKATLKFCDGKLHLVVNVDGEETLNVVMEGEEAKEQKISYETIFLALLADFENFEYDADKNIYKNPNAVTTTIHVSYASAIVVMENGRVTLSEDGKLVKFECKYTQTTTSLEYTGTLVVEDAIFELFNYGTTVIE